MGMSEYKVWVGGKKGNWKQYLLAESWLYEIKTDKLISKEDISK